jgi:MFS family permease
MVNNKFKPWIMWGLGALFFAYEFLLQVSPSVMVHDLMRAFSVNAAQLGNLSAFYLYAYALMQIPVGMLLDRFGTRRLLTFASLLCAIGAFIFGSASSFPVASGGRFLIGFGSSFAAVSAMHIAATWLPINRFALMVGVMLTIGFLGAICGQAPLSLLIAKIGWRETLLLFGFIGILLSILIWSFIRDRQLPETTHHEVLTQRRFFSGLNLVMSNVQIWIAAIYSGLMYLPTPAFTALWGVPFLIISYHLNATTAAFIISMTYIGFAVGSPFFGWFSDRIRRRRPPMVIGTIGALISILCILYIPNIPLVLMGICLFAFGFFSSGSFAAFSLARELSPLWINATALGFVNTLNSLGGALAQPFIGFLLDMRWQGQMTEGVRAFSVTDFHWALAALPICMTISLLMLPFIKETYCRPKVN